MFSFTRTASLFLIFVVPCFAQRPPRPQPAAPSPTSNISGRVTEGDKGVAGISIVAAGGAVRPGSIAAAARAVTDADGRYVLTGVAPGQYTLIIHAPAYVPPFDTRFGPGKIVNVYSGETIESMDFKLQRGAVITGRVSDADGEPVVAVSVRLLKVDERGQVEPDQPHSFHPEMMLTDDRGVYRIYGLAPGRYKVSFGFAADGSTGGPGGRRGYYRQTFHPDAPDQAQARVITLGEGDEATDVDIKLGPKETTYRVKGRVLDADTNLPVPGVALALGITAAAGGGQMGFMGGPDHTSDANGEFDVFGIVPNRYTVSVLTRGFESGNGEYYGEPTGFEVADRDVSGVEVKVRRGVSLSGVVVVDGGAAKKAMTAPLGRVMLATERVSAASATPMSVRDNKWVQAEPGGQFQFKGLRPGRFKLTAFGGERQRVTLLRVERNGVDVSEGFEVAAGEHVADVRVVVQQGTGAISGTVKVSNGELPGGMSLHVGARPLNPADGGGGEAARQRQGYGGMVDELGRFVVEGLPGGDYELTLNWRFTRPPQQPPGPGGRFHLPPPPPEQKQIVSVADGARAEATFELDLSAASSPPTSRPQPEVTP